MPGAFSPQRVSDPDMHHGTCMPHVPWCMPGSLSSGFLWSRWRRKRFRHSRRMRNSQFYVSGKRPITSQLPNRLDILHRARQWNHRVMCSILKPIGFMKQMLWTNEILRVVRLRWISGGYPILHEAPGCVCYGISWIRWASARLQYLQCISNWIQVPYIKAWCK